MAHICIEDLNLTWLGGGEADRVAPRVLFEHFQLEVARGEFLVLMGPSGSGKTTLLNIIGGLDPLDQSAAARRRVSGRVLIEGVEPAKLKGPARAAFLNRHMGFIFAGTHLIPELNLLDNVALPVQIAGFSRRESCRRAREWLAQLDLEQDAAAFPADLSGGERRRAAVARALINQPSIVLADEPAGGLDLHLKQRVLGMLDDANRAGATVILSAHDPGQWSTVTQRGTPVRVVELDVCRPRVT